ncbi:MAG: nicotinate-nucleotide adenylyltransferase [Bacteroidales bacterium]|nr:nicotinate-nucleotide adenylyltransferase [Bacteroidales bacterium]MBN2631921.1 nicotinate-nucleotide adenylyltransferase [Bacteroidales bacterium]
MSKIGLYFGSFNPIHIGHLAIAGYITEFTPLDEVWFIVSPHNPLKKKDSLLEDYHRLYMTELAIGDNYRLRASDIEFRLPLPSYTINTLAYLGEKHPQHEFSLIMGEDNLYTLHKWKNAEELISKCNIYVYPRPYTSRPSSAGLDMLLSKARVHRVKAPMIEISGTFIRSGIKKGKNMSYFLPPAVWKYISEMHFYEK